MRGLNDLASAVLRSLGLNRDDDLRHRLEQLERRDADRATLEDRRWSHLCGHMEQVMRQLIEIQQYAVTKEGFDSPRWDALGSRLDALSRDLQDDALRTEKRLSDIGHTAQGAHDRAHDAMRKVYQIDDLLRSRSRVFGHEMFLDPTDSIVSPLLLRDGYFEPYETSLIEAEIRPGDVVLDVGANIGYYTLIFARLVGERGRVYAFEPDPTNFRLLKKNVRANGYQNVVFVKKAVADVSGTSSLFLCPDNKGDHRLFDSYDGRDSVTIEATTLDEHFAEFQGQINFIKMDIQGSEGRAVRGMQGLLRRYREIKIITEFWPAGLRRSGIGAREYLADLERLGFRLFRIDEDEETTEPTSAEELLALFTEDREEFSNLYCARCA
jgi:FkbM family methyltransferase